jgi:phage terminase large subunit-like protein
MNGEIPINAEIEMEMHRIDDLIADPTYWYDEDAIKGFIAFCEGELVLTDGSPFRMLDSFKLWAEQIFGWYWFDTRSVYEPNPDGHGGHFVTKTIKRRLTTKQYLIVARGAAKSMYAMAIQAYFLVVDPHTTHQITTAPTMKQAEEVLTPLATAITRARGPVFKFLTEGSLQNTTGNRNKRQQLASTKKGIQDFVTGSILEIRPMSVNKLQGARPKVATIDEWLSGDLREDVVAALEQGSSKEQSGTPDDDYLIVAISSEGTVRAGSGDTIKMELQEILRGDYFAPHISIFHYKLDTIEEVGMPERWLKANPNLGITVLYDTYHKDVERSEKAPATKNDILAKRFGIPREGFTYFFTYEETQPPTKRRHNFDHLPCSMGVDLSMGDDFCAFTFLFPLAREQFGVKGRSYITSLTYAKLDSARKMKYDDFIAEGSLIVFEGTILDMDLVYEDLEKFVDDHNFDVRSVGYDVYGAKEFINRWSIENGDHSIEKVIQGARTESIPLGELKNLASQKLLLFDQKIMTFTMGNSITMEDTNGNRKLLKRREENKIDNVSAMMDAMVAYKLHKEEFE